MTDHEENRELARVHYLPTTRPDPDEGEVLEGEVLTAAQYNALQRQKAIERYRAYRRDAVTVVRGVKTVVGHDVTKTLARHGLAYPVAGVRVVVKRWRDAHGASRYERMMRAAELEGNHEALLEWEARDVAEKQRRHERTMDWVRAPGQWIKAGAIGTAGVTGLLLACGVVLAIHNGDIGDVLGPITAVLNAVAFVVWFVTAYGVFLVAGGTAAGLAYLYQQGKRYGDTPAWLAATPAGAVSLDAAVDESMIMNALRNLGHPALNKKFKEGWGTAVQPTWVQPPLPVGHGWEFSLRLPGGVPATSINARKSVLAHNLGRRPEEVWVEVADTDPMAMKCLVLDPGSLREPVPDYPLLDGGRTDFWTGFPVGIDARWNPVDTPVFERNFVLAGIMGSGKSTLLQDLLAGAVLDPVVDIDVFCFADNNDYEWLRPVASLISMGDTAANVDACRTHIEELHASLAERGKLLREYGIDAVTRDAAEKDARLRPRIVVVDECQSFFRQDKPEDRRELVNQMVRFYSAARKYGIVLAFATPTPSDQSLPRDLVAVTTNKACFAIGDKARNNIVLGEKAYENGLSALELKPAVKKAGKVVALNDVGTAVTVGYMEHNGLLRSYNLTHQQKTALVERGIELRGGQVRRRELTEPEHRDLLADVAAVLKPGEEKVKATDVCARLRDLAPGHRDYKSLTADELRERLEAQGCKVTKVGVLTVFTERVHAALAAREGGNA
ncbi:DNA segregation ATPase FtsK/SpoIIIE, S-DNA-T family [Amycolatopsis sacchari]|uniref:DNA segregation ATPase FtsK/SpoIIIE, S-DNA-T family n=1 Tax=Amycolatopsis sacchari TaxID=115433 RepID=A0A1I3TZ74_9PSEU|nr:FtsK/SpoIIIE domain-containing protein [Amycolatopsis sacchari]SFJ76574.1 DNA segregation ATPase FtsK/SpoIIIE, S-DNA-T family [Amycolatopsis sacchari]